MTKNLLCSIFLFQVSVSVAVLAAAATTTTTTTINGNNFKEFIEEFENLVLQTTDAALIVTTHVYGNLTKTLPPILKEAVQPITAEYVHRVKELFKLPRHYTAQRKLLRQFRNNNMQIEKLLLKLQPTFPKYEFHLISHDFYYTGKNVTEFDNLYAEFMLKFQLLSQSLWNTMTEEVVEEQQDLLEILDEIANEKELNEKDKLYDEFIEMFLFKADVDVNKNRHFN